MAENLAGFMDQIDGFPVHTTNYRGGVLVDETSLESLVEKYLGGELFTSPEGYRRIDPFRRR